MDVRVETVIVRRETLRTSPVRGINQDFNVNNTRKKVGMPFSHGKGKYMRCLGWLIHRRIFRSSFASVLSIPSHSPRSYSLFTHVQYTSTPLISDRGRATRYMHVYLEENREWKETKSCKLMNVEEPCPFFKKIREVCQECISLWCFFVCPNVESSIFNV